MPTTEEIIILSLRNQGFKDTAKNIELVKQQLQELTPIQKAVNRITDKMTRSTKRFRAEYLSTMFAGMALTNVFGNLLRPTAELFGIFDLWAITLQTVFLPVMEMIFPLILRLLEWFMGLPPWIQEAIGLFVLLGFGIGKLMTIISMAVLGFMGLAIIFGGVAGAITFLTGAAVIGALIVAAILLIKHWDEVKEAFNKVWDGIKQTFVNVINFLIDKLNWFLDNFINPLLNNRLVKAVLSKLGIDVAPIQIGKMAEPTTTRERERQQSLLPEFRFGNQRLDLNLNTTSANQGNLMSMPVNETLRYTPMPGGALRR